MNADKDSPGYVSSGSFLLSAYQGWLTYYLNIYDIDKKKYQCVESGTFRDNKANAMATEVLSPYITRASAVNCNTYAQKGVLIFQKNSTTIAVSVLRNGA